MSTVNEEDQTAKESSCNEQQIVMQHIGEQIRTQDNRCTSDPLFIVQQKQRIWGMDLNYTDDYAWLDTSNEHTEATDVEAAGLDAIEDKCGDLGDWEKVGYVDTWEFITACFTEKACQDYIAANGHNLNEPRIYAASAYRNLEMIAVREMLKTA